VFHAIIVPDVPDLKQRGPQARDTHCNKLDVVQAQSVTDTDTGLAPIAESSAGTGGRDANSGLCLDLSLHLYLEWQGAKAKARVVVDTSTIHGFVAQ